MPRPRICRRVRFRPNVTYFKPAGVRMRELEEVTLTVDEYEAVRLKDLEGLDQEVAAKKMQADGKSKKDVKQEFDEDIANEVYGEEEKGDNIISYWWNNIWK